MIPPEVVVVGASQGGLQALQRFLSAMPADFPLPVVTAQHRQVESEERLVSLLQQHTKLRVREAEDKGELAARTVYLAPTDYHLLLEPGGLALSTEAPVCFARPSIDVLFESTAASFGAAAAALVLTGASVDGAAGAAAIGRAGGVVLVQDPGTSANSVMPVAAIAATPSAQVLPLQDMAHRLVALSQSRVRSLPSDASLTAGEERPPLDGR